MDSQQNTSHSQEENQSPEPAVETTPVVQPAPLATAVIQSPVADTKNTNTLLIIIAILVILAGVQVFQTRQLLAAVSTGSINAGPAPAAQGGGAQLQSQVGGCG